jgi:hypothetical protein
VIAVALQGWMIGVITGAAGLVSGLVSAAANTWLANRSKVSEELREQRLKAYPDVWQRTATFSRWPRNTVTNGELSEFERDLRSWYYRVGGLYMSENARRRYGHAQELVSAYREGREQTHHVTPDAYQDLMEACSAFRTALTEDLESRRQGSVVYWVQKSLERRAQERVARGRLRRATAGDPREDASLPAAVTASHWSG